MTPLTDLAELVAVLRARRVRQDAARALLVGLSGIDGAGKGWIAAALAARLGAAGLRVATLHADGWLALPAERFGGDDPVARFYTHALRLDEFFARVARPLRDTRSVDVVVDHAEETATAFTPRRLALTDVDIVLVEGIFLFKRAYRAEFDVAVWVDCSAETALERALARAQEGLPPAATAHAYRTLYFPAQRLHADRDTPRAAADYVLSNDDRLARD